MKIIKLEVGSLMTNCYIVYCEKSRKCAVIDPGGSASDIMSCIRREALEVLYIINTHGHADHIGALGRIRQETGAKVLIHKDDADMLTSSVKNLSCFMGADLHFEPADILLNDGDKIQVGDIIFTVRHTPGHTPGGICLETNEVVFCGDTIFYESIGRTDFEGGSYSQLIKSIKDKVLTLDDGVKLLPGHGPETSVGWERRMNPFIQ